MSSSSKSPWAPSQITVSNGSRTWLGPVSYTHLYDTFSKLDKKDSAEPAAAEKRTQESALKGARILLVEDNELNQEIAKTLLEMNGATVDVAGNGEVAIRCFCDQKPGTYQAILMDIRMPVMDCLLYTSPGLQPPC